MIWELYPLYSTPTRLVEYLYFLFTDTIVSGGRHVAPLGHIILIPRQQVCCFSL